MSYGTTLRQALEALLCGESGTTRVLTAGRFHRRSPDRPDPPADSSERAVEIELSPGTPTHVLNNIDSYALFDHRLVVRVFYALTLAGGDLAEGLTEQTGPGTWDAIRDRAMQDAHDVGIVLGWGENVAGLSPAIVQMLPAGGPSGPVARGNVAVLELPFSLQVWARNDTVGHYAP
jgi:hypothetical protein